MSGAPMRMLTALDAPDLTRPPMGPRPVLEWVPLSRLVVSTAYQRELGERSRRMVRKGVEAFSWRRFKALNVARREDGRFEVLDGQHGAVILLTHGGATEAPCLISGEAETGELAGDFVAINVNRVGVTPMQKFQAMLAAGDANAVAVRDAAADAGAVILRTARTAGKYSAGQTVATPALLKIAEARGGEAVRDILKPCVASGVAPIKADLIRAVEVLLFSDEYAGEISGETIARTVAARGDALLDAADLARLDLGEPLYRALAIEIFREATDV